MFKAPGCRLSRWAPSRLIIGLSLPLIAGCSDAHLSFLDPQGPIAAAQRQHFWWVIAITLTVVLPVLVLTPLILWRYRYGGRARYRPQWEFSLRADLAIWGIPLLVFAVLATLTWRSTIALDPYRPLVSDQPPLEVQVVGFDWQWLFLYPEQGIATVDELVIPAGRPVSLRLTSASVMQGFFVPALGSQIDVMNHMVTRLHLEADAPGVFPGRNMQYSGKEFYRQRFVTRALSADAFADFTHQVRAQGRSFTPEVFSLLMAKNTHAALARALDGTETAAITGRARQTDDAGSPADDSTPLRFKHFPSGLFEAIAAHRAPDWSQDTSSLSTTRPLSPDSLLPASSPLSIHPALAAAAPTGATP